VVNHVQDQSHLLVARQLPANTSALVCTTPKCLEYAKLVKSNLSPKYKEIDPCEDFSAYACDGWRQTHDFRPEQSSKSQWFQFILTKLTLSTGVSIGSTMSDTIKSVLLDILSNPYKESAAIQGVNATFDKANFGKMKDAYDTCMNEEGVKAYGVTPIVKLLEEFDKVYPEKGPNPTVANRDELTNALIWLAKNNVAGLVGAGTTVSARSKLIGLQDS
jgi:endothelin-converting enzyme